MKIAMVGFRGIPHTYGGGEDLVRYLAPGLVSRGHDVIVYCRYNLFKNHDKYHKGVRRIFLPTIEHKFFGQLFHAFFSIIDLLFRKVDIIYIHTLPSGVYSIIPWIFNKRIVVNPNGFDWKRGKWGFFGKLYFRLSARICLFTAKEFITDSKAIRRYYLDSFNRDSTFVAYGTQIQKSENKEIINKYDVVGRDYYLIACRLVPENNIDLIIKAFSQTNSKKKLLVAGNANFKNSWVHNLYSINDPRIKFLGHISDQNMLKELHCNCFAYLHGHSMGGINPSLVKALGHENCVLALNTPYNSEVLISDNGVQYGIFFEKDYRDLKKIIEKLEANPSIAESYRQKATKRIYEAFTYGHIVSGYEKAFIKALK